MDDQDQGNGDRQKDGGSAQTNQGQQPVLGFLAPVPVLGPPPVIEPPVVVPAPPPPTFAPPPVEVPPIVEVAPWLVFLAVLFYPTSTAPPWADELNPITGGPYKNKEEYDSIRQLSQDEIRKRAADYRRQQLQKAQTATQNSTCESPVGSSTEPCPTQDFKPSPAPSPAPAPIQQPSQKPAPDEVIKLECDDGWNDCQKRQAREKVRRLNELAKQKGGLNRRSTEGWVRDLGNSWAKKYRRDFERLCKGQEPSKYEFTKEGVSGPTGKSQDFMDDCLFQEWQEWKRDHPDCEDVKDSPLSQMSPDHIQDLQWNGHVQGQMVWLDRDVNEKLGRDMNSGENKKVKRVKEFQLECD